jgi:hypothetical protein
MASGISSYGPALLAVVVAGAAAWLSWRKLQLDLFQKRFDAYQEISQQGHQFFAQVKAPFDALRPEELESVQKIVSAGTQIQFLFNPDVNSKFFEFNISLVELFVASFRWHRLSERMEQAPKDAEDIAERRVRFLNSLGAFQTACHPAMRQYSLFWYYRRLDAATWMAPVHSAYQRMRGRRRRLWSTSRGVVRRWRNKISADPK